MPSYIHILSLGGYPCLNVSNPTGRQDALLVGVKANLPDIS
jgi:hypothetical protein